MTLYILFFTFHVIIYGPRVCNKHLNKINKSYKKIKVKYYRLPNSTLMTCLVKAVKNIS